MNETSPAKADRIMQKRRVNSFDDNLDLTAKVIYFRQTEPYLNARDENEDVLTSIPAALSGAYLIVRDRKEVLLLMPRNGPKWRFTSMPGIGKKLCLPQRQGWAEVVLTSMPGMRQKWCLRQHQG